MLPWRMQSWFELAWSKERQLEYSLQCDAQLLASGDSRVAMTSPKSLPALEKLNILSTLVPRLSPGVAITLVLKDVQGITSLP